MIGRLRGTVSGGTERGLILDVGGVGYRVHTNPQSSAKWRKERGEIVLYTHLAVREDSLDLYGFETEEELSFFELLLSVSGIGPRSALSILAVGDIGALRRAIGAGDTSYLTKISGIGKKTAERIILDLRDKAGGGSAEEAAQLRGDVDVLEALRALGYAGKEARDAVVKVSREGMDTNQKLKAALRELGSGV